MRIRHTEQKIRMDHEQVYLEPCRDKHRRRYSHIALWGIAGVLAFAVGIVGGYAAYSWQADSSAKTVKKVHSSNGVHSKSKDADAHEKKKEAPPVQESSPVSDDAGVQENQTAGDAARADASIADSVAAIEQYYGAQVQVAWLSEAGVQSAGNLTDLPAWSTSKVPLAMATIHAGLGAQQGGNITAAIRASDNAAAEALWQSLAPDDVSRAAAVTNILRLAGDSSTTVPSVRTFGSYTIFGQTQWSTADQVRFLTQMEALPGGLDVKEHMRGVDANQRWGIGRWEGSAVKGGWGPTRFGGYTARQMGWYWHDGVEVPIAIAAQAGSFDAAVGVVDAVAAIFQ